MRESGLLVDPETGSSTVLAHEVYENHRGNVFHITNYETEALNGTIEFVATVPAGNIKPHVRVDVQGTDGVSLHIYENPTSVVGGTTATPINRNRSSSKTSVITIKKDPTSIGGDGTLLVAESVGADKEAGDLSNGVGMILNPGDSYLYRITSLGNDNIISYRAFWAEVQTWQEE